MTSAGGMSISIIRAGFVNSWTATSNVEISAYGRRGLFRCRDVAHGTTEVPNSLPLACGRRLRAKRLPLSKPGLVDRADIHRELDARSEREKYPELGSSADIPLALCAVEVSA
jgi:hypothetical protein